MQNKHVSNELKVDLAEALYKLLDEDGMKSVEALRVIFPIVDRMIEEAVQASVEAMSLRYTQLTEKRCEVYRRYLFLRFQEQMVCQQ